MPWPTLLLSVVKNCCTAVYFCGLDGYLHAGSLRDGVKTHPTSSHDVSQIFFVAQPASRICLGRGPKLSERHVFTLTGV